MNFIYYQTINIACYSIAFFNAARPFTMSKEIFCINANLNHSKLLHMFWIKKKNIVPSFFKKVKDCV